jgi:hypothetical protein
LRVKSLLKRQGWSEGSSVEKGPSWSLKILTFEINALPLFNLLALVKGVLK